MLKEVGDRHIVNRSGDVIRPGCAIDLLKVRGVAMKVQGRAERKEHVVVNDVARVRSGPLVVLDGDVVHTRRNLVHQMQPTLVAPDGHVPQIKNSPVTRPDAPLCVVLDGGVPRIQRRGFGDFDAVFAVADSEGDYRYLGAKLTIKVLN